ncbi:MAG: hypothetical protein ACLSFZ_00850 [Frisingicoccus sp.]
MTEGNSGAGDFTGLGEKRMRFSDDGKMEVEVLECNSSQMLAKVFCGGVLKSRKYYPKRRSSRRQH